MDNRLLKLKKILWSSNGRNRGVRVTRINRKEYLDVKTIWKESSCLKDCYDKVEDYVKNYIRENYPTIIVERTDIRPLAESLANAVINDYKYMKII